MRRYGVLFAFLLACGHAAGAEITVTNGGLRLKADLLLPDESVCAKCPLLVIAQGSGTSSRDNPWTKAWAESLVANGIAVIHPDKRGSGKSDGDWRTAGIEDLASDVSAFVHFASDQPRIDRDRIGVIGFSQGGDVVPVAAARNGKIRFVVSVSGSVVPLAEQMLDELLIDASGKGLTDAQMVAIRDLHSAVMQYARDPRDYAAVAAAKRAGASAHVPAPFLDNVPASTDAGIWGWLHRVAGFDPMPYWKRLAVPVVFVYGGRDSNVDATKSVLQVERELMVGDAPVSLVFFNENGHALFRKEAVQFVAAFARSAGAND